MHNREVKEHIDLSQNCLLPPLPTGPWNVFQAWALAPFAVYQTPHIPARSQPSESAFLPGRLSTGKM
ncbi:unnamed protein product [Ixodes persulcatus]